MEMDEKKDEAKRTLWAAISDNQRFICQNGYKLRPKTNLKT